MSTVYSENLKYGGQGKNAFYSGAFELKEAFLKFTRDKKDTVFMKGLTDGLKCVRF